MLPQFLTTLAECLPVYYRVLFSPAGMVGEVGDKRYVLFGQKLAFEVEYQGLETLGAVIDGQN